jgi:hypothetical protein
MNSEKHDLLGWLLAAGAALLAVSAVMKAGEGATSLLAWSLLLIIVNERRRAKVVTAALIRVVDEKGACRGLIGWDGQGIQVGVRTDSLNNLVCAYPVLWQKVPSVVFSFRHTHSETSSGELIERSPTIGVAGEIQKEWRSYEMQFSYNVAAAKPDVAIAQHSEDHILCRSIPLS